MKFYSVFFGGTFIYASLDEEHALYIASSLRIFNTAHDTDYDIKVIVEEEESGCDVCSVC